MIFTYDICEKWITCLAVLMVIQQISAYTQCEYSLLKVNYVRDCPTDAVSWNKAAERMDCQSIEQNCSGLNPQQYVFQYHCVVNGWMNATLEVCAFNRSILGYCAEFNTRGAMIQDHYATDCTYHEPPCPSNYNSAEAYKYPTCYNMARQNRLTSQENPVSSTARLVRNTAMMFVSIIVGVFI